jgi:hypothetical protein
MRSYGFPGYGKQNIAVVTTHPKYSLFSDKSQQKLFARIGSLKPIDNSSPGRFYCFNGYFQCFRWLNADSDHLFYQMFFKSLGPKGQFQARQPPWLPLLYRDDPRMYFDHCLAKL